MVTTSVPALAARIKVAALHGLSADAWMRYSDRGFRHYEVVMPGYKYNMTDIQAALGLVQLRRLEAGQRRRAEIWRAYDEAFAGLPCRTPAPPDAHSVHARHLYTLLIGDDAPVSRDEFMARLQARGIGTGVHYRALHLHRYYRDRFGYRPEDFPNAAWISDRTVSLPLSGKLTDREVERVIAAAQAALTSKSHATSRLPHSRQR
jgi:dTDP-4-amino-4,6-dideoxygalactose transaminase